MLCLLFLLSVPAIRSPVLRNPTCCECKPPLLVRNLCPQQQTSVTLNEASSHKKSHPANGRHGLYAACTPPWVAPPVCAWHGHTAVGFAQRRVHTLRNRHDEQTQQHDRHPHPRHVWPVSLVRQDNPMNSNLLFSDATVAGVAG